MANFIDLLKELGIVLGAIASLYKSYKEIVKPYLIRRRKIKAFKLKNKKKWTNSQ